ncbi:MAG TPA: DNA repair protein RecO [Aestuariivirgaceae bacterium]|nr:DNA repair protein RecO [Aestuariivirgaceae bacterium]
MHWSEEAVVLGVRRHGETSAIVDLLTRGHGRHLGLVRGGRSRRARPVLQPGNLVLANWRARLEDQLGTFTVEPVAMRAAGLIADPFKLAGLTSLTGLSQVLPEREPHPRLYDALSVALAALDDDEVWPAVLARFELGLLDELGFGLDLTCCAATGAQDDLVFVSPRTGRAVSAAAGAPYRDRLFALPGFLRDARPGRPRPEEVIAGLRLTGHFLQRHILEPRDLAAPGARALLIERLARRTGAARA